MYSVLLDKREMEILLKKPNSKFNYIFSLNGICFLTYTFIFSFCLFPFARHLSYSFFFLFSSQHFFPVSSFPGCTSTTFSGHHFFPFSSFDGNILITAFILKKPKRFQRKPFDKCLVVKRIKKKNRENFGVHYFICYQIL